MAEPRITKKTRCWPCTLIGDPNVQATAFRDGDPYCDACLKFEQHTPAHKPVVPPAPKIEVVASPSPAMLSPDEAIEEAARRRKMRSTGVRVVKRSSIVPFKRAVLGKYRNMLDDLLDLPADEALQIATKNPQEGGHIRREIGKLAKKKGLAVGWERNAQGTAYSLWIDRPRSA